jgi:hypothetical protein
MGKVVSVRFPVIQSLLSILLGSSAHAALIPMTSFGGGDGYLSPGDAPYLNTLDTERGLAYSPARNHLYLVSRSANVGGLQVPILHGDTGEKLGELNLTGISGGTLTLSHVRVADDGAIYAANLIAPSSSTSAILRVYRWADESSVPTVAFAKTMGTGQRFGDSMDVRGSGAGTQIILGQGTVSGGPTANNVVLLTTSDGTTFADRQLNVSGAASGDFRLAVAFGAGDTFYGRQTGANLRLAGFDPIGGTGSVTATNTSFPTSLVAIDVDPTTLVMSAVETVTGATDGPHTTRVYDVSDFANPVLIGSAQLPTQNRNTNGAGSSQVYGDRVYVLDTNNGIVAYTIPEPTTGMLLLTCTIAGALTRRRGRGRD